LGEQAGRVADQIWGDGEEGLTRAACQRWRGTAMGEEGRQAGVGVTGGVRTVGEEVLGGAKHGVGKGSAGGRRKKGNASLGGERLL
jgi:hypothetical protein